ncbi:MAG: TldE/PmbA family protein [Proteobacteria bacterium]|nr:TldE/PmbA family protein [Pseudomonadota bacterium]
MRSLFESTADHLTAQLSADEVLLLEFAGEGSDFVRFNGGKVRQAGHVDQAELWLDLIRGRRHAAGRVALSGQVDTDRARTLALLGRLRDALPHVPEDPHLLYSTDVTSSVREGADGLPSAGEITDDVLAAADGTDLVGILASGGIYRGFANSLGQRNWFGSHSFNLDWSLYHHGDKATKCGYAGETWDTALFADKMADARRQLSVVGRSAHKIEPGKYRVYLAPAALSEIVELLGWGGFGLKTQKTRRSPLLRAVEGECTLSPAVHLTENVADGLAPNFGAGGFLRPDQVQLFDGGQYKDSLVSPRSAQEYGVPTTGADAGEFPDSLDLAPGACARDAVLGELGTGIYVNNLWYLNYSDRPACRVTGMTRFATFWVENGEIVAPVDVMRFDETLYHVLGEGLVSLTEERDFLMSASTYDRRSTSSSRLPGALVNDFTFTL